MIEYNTLSERPDPPISRAFRTRLRGHGHTGQVGHGLLDVRLDAEEVVHVPGVECLQGYVGVKVR
jgi:hypothetical protein